MDPLPIADPGVVDLDRHGVIEASAGTGKTYCLENLVVRLLCERQVPLEQILLVTFTEKATSDLHERIRRKILGVLRAGQGPAGVLHEAIENFDTAAIFTIHGFCQRVLQQYAFENGGSFELEVAADEPLYESRLRLLQRRDWPSRYGGQLGDMLALADYPAAKGGVSQWEQKVLRLGRLYRPEGGDRLLPEPAAAGATGAADAEVARVLDAVVAALGEPAQPLPKSKLYWWYQRLPLANAVRYHRLFELVLPVLEFLARHRERPRGVVEFAGLVNRCAECQGFDKKGFAVLWDGVEPPAESFSGAARTATAAFDDLMARVDIRGLSARLAVETIRQLKAEVRTFKDARGLIGFDDMLLLVARALDPAQNARAAALTAQLRRRFRYALVDEFQDTDAVQWQVFSRLFLGSPDHRLFTIGDPKQAIYGFRGADLHTYLRATQQMRGDHGAGYYSLPVNWRATPELITAVNRLCGVREWFGAAGPVRFLPVSPPPPDQRQVRLHEDRTGRAALTVVDLEAADRTLTQARRWLGRFIADEIVRLLGDRQLRFTRGGETRRLRPSDICVLLRKGSESADVEEFLTKNEVPYTFYKKSGLYQSAEARQLFYLFAAIAAPGDRRAVRRALLTRFFAVPPAALAAAAELPATYAPLHLLRTWNAQAEQRQWAPLFQSLLEDTGLLFRENQDPHGERRLTNYQQILQDLEQLAQTANLDFVGLLDRLRHYHLEEADLSEDTNLHRIDAEGEKVQLMNIHTCKGLEFPVVFLGGGFTRSPEDAFWRYHDTDGHLVYDLARTAAAKPQYEAELAAEDRRLFYVAVTRAILKLYVPRFRPQRSNAWFGPVPTFIHGALASAFDGQDGLEVRHVDVNGRDVDARRPWTPVVDPEPAAEPAAGRTADAGTALPQPLLPPAGFAFGRRLRLIGSFSGFVRRQGRHAAAPGLLAPAPAFAEEAAGGDDGLAPAGATEPEPAVAAALRLPDGEVTGSLIHEVLEQVPFAAAAAAVRPEDLLAPGGRTGAIVDAALRRFAFPPPPGGDVSAWRLPIARMVHAALTTPLADDGFRLADLPPADCRHEVEFLLPVPPPAEAPERAVRDGCVTGFIDLVFRRGRRYFFLDWKTNALEGGFAPAALAASMDAAGYRLQYRIYTVAVWRWLEATVPGFDPERDFGGIYYLYLRGLQTGRRGDGIFFHRPANRAAVAGYLEEIARLFRVGA